MTCHLFLYPALGEDLTSNASASGVAGNLKRGQNANSARSNLLVSGGGNDRGGDLSACSNVDGISLRSSLSATDNDSTNQIRNIIEVAFGNFIQMHTKTINISILKFV